MNSNLVEFELRSGKTNASCVSSVDITLGILLLVAVLFGSSAKAQTCPGPPTSSLMSVDYDPLSSVDTVQDFTMSMPARPGFISSDSQGLSVWKQSPGYETEGVRYEFQFLQGGSFSTNSFNSQAMGDVGLNWRGNDNKDRYAWSGNVAAQAVGTTPVRIAIAKNQPLAVGLRTIEFASHGSYEEYFQTNACPYDNGRIAFAVQTFTLNVASSMALSLAGGSTTGTIDFGDGLATAATRSTNLRVRSNTPYRVTMDSAFNGVLKLNNEANSTQQIAYTATLNGTPISETTLFTNTNPTGTGGADVTLPFEIKIGDTSNVRAGFYKDVVTLTISSGL